MSIKLRSRCVSALLVFFASAAAHAQCNLPPAPTGVSGTEGCRQTTIRWNAVPGATSYRIVGTNFGGGSVFNVLHASTTYVYNPSPGVPATNFTVSAINSCGEGPAAPTIAVEFASSAPILDVNSVTASDGVFCSDISITWSDFTGLANLGYRITRTATGQPTATFNVPPNQFSFTDTTALDGVVYTYAVAMVNGCGAGPANSDTGFRARIAPVQPLPVAAPRGSTAVLTAPFLASGFTGLTYTWRRGVSPIGAGGTTVVDGPRVSGASTAQLTITDLRPEDAALYACSVTACGAPVFSGAIALVVTTTCHADYDGRNGATVLDVFRFLEDWFNGCP